MNFFLLFWGQGAVRKTIFLLLSKYHLPDDMYTSFWKYREKNDKNIFEFKMEQGKRNDHYFIFYEYFTNIFILLFSDPDLDIQVDLKREEEEKNGRRKYLHKRFSCIVDLLRNRKQISPQKQSFIDFVLFWKFYTPITTTHYNGFLGFFLKL